MSAQKISLLVLGAQGQAGRELLALCGQRGVKAVGLSRADCDIAARESVTQALDAHSPLLAVNCAAYTAVDKAESEEALAMQANADGPGILAQETARRGLPLLHVSTDYVFDGTKTGAYVEADPVAPMGAYGRSKLAGELAVREANQQHIILRTAWVYGVHGHNFLKTMMRLARERDGLRVVGDQRGCPTSTADIAEAILAVSGKLAGGEQNWGVYHFAGTGETSWHGFASEIVRAQAHITGKNPPVSEITTADYPTPARRPANSALNSSKFAETFGYRAHGWQERTRETVAALLAAESN